jgi:MoxR-like ATPase
VTPDDVKAMALPVLRHRVLLRPEAEVEGLTADRILTSRIEAQTVPR